MDNFHYHYKKIVLITTIIMLAVLVLSVIKPNAIYTGFVLGSAISIVNIYIIYRNVVNVTEKKSANQLNHRSMSGITWRIFFVIIAVFLANRSPNIDVFATIFGVFFAQIVAYIYFFFNSIRNSNLKGGKM